MSAEAAVAVKKWTVGRYTCELSLARPKPGAVMSVVIEWSPEMPASLTDTERAEYATGRNRAFRALAAELGLRGALMMDGL